MVMDLESRGTDVYTAGEVVRYLKRVAHTESGADPRDPPSAQGREGPVVFIADTAVLPAAGPTDGLLLMLEGSESANLPELCAQSREMLKALGHGLPHDK